MVYINGTDVPWNCINAMGGKCGTDLVFDPGVVFAIAVIIIVCLVAVRFIFKAQEIRMNADIIRRNRE